jgi:hypothetical protein
MFESQARHQELAEKLKDQKGMLICHYCQQAVQIVDKLNEEPIVVPEKTKLKQLLLFAKSAKHESSDEEMHDDRPSEELAMWLGIDKATAVHDASN